MVEIEQQLEQIANQLKELFENDDLTKIEIKSSKTNIRSLIGSLNDVLEDFKKFEGENIEKKSQEEAFKRAEQVANIGHWQLDLLKNKLYWSDHTYRIFGFKPQSFYPTYETFLSFIPTEERERVNSAYTNSLSSKMPYSIVHRVICSDGRRKFLQENCETDYDDNNNPIRSIGTVLDVTDKMIAFEKLAESDNRYEALVNSAADAIIILNKNQSIVSWNAGAENLFKYNEAEIRNENIKMLIPEKDKLRHSRVFESVNSKIDEFVLSEYKPIRDCIAIDKAKNEIPVEVRVSSWHEEGEVMYGAIVRDLTDRKKQEEQLKNSLKEKQYLLEEINHRVKNNLQVVLAILDLQLNVNTKSTKDILKDSMAKISSMAVIHESLNRSDNYTSIKFKEYVSELLSKLKIIYTVPNQSVDIKLNSPEISITLPYAAPIGLIICELVSNSYKHAFLNKESHKIHINLRIDDDIISLNYSDSNTGNFDSGENYLESKSMGMKLLKNIAKQIDGELELNVSKGFQYILKWSNE